jgi:phage terminase large subunit-like protein
LRHAIISRPNWLALHGIAEARPRAPDHSGSGETAMIDGAYFDPGVELDVQFIESLTLTKTRSGQPQPFKLLPFQKRFVANVLGWKRADGARLYRKAFYSTARKNAKTQLAAAIALDLLVIDNEPSPEIYIAAKDRDQASFCFSAAAQMVDAHDELRDMLDVVPYAKEIRNRRNGGLLKALSSEGRTKHGSSPSTVVFDEFHVWGPAEEELFSALTTGSGARRQPLFIITTTAGVDEYSLCFREYEYCRRILDGTVEDPTYYPQIHEVPADADWTDESLWGLANPGLGEILQIDSLREDFKKASAMPSEQAKFRRLNLNQWTKATSEWIPIRLWDACASESFSLEDLHGKPCCGGLDLASTGDLTAFVLAWKIGKIVVYPWFFIPEQGIRERSHKDGVRYDLWSKDKHIELTPGAVTDWRFVTKRILQLAEQFEIKSIGFDRFGARDTVSDLQEAGLTVADTGQGYVSQSAPTKRLEELILNKDLVHSGHPILRWNMACATISSDAAGNIKVVKPARMRSTKRVDVAVALVMAIDQVMRQPPDDGESIYETRGLISL